MIIALQTLVFFRQTLLSALERVIQPYYKKVVLAFTSDGDDLEEDDPDEQVFSEFDQEKGVIFYPPMYAQRYAAVSDCLMDERWRGKLEKVVDFGYHDISFIKYLKEVPGVKRILGVDIESMYLRCSSDLFSCDEFLPKRENPLQITLFQGNAADPDYRLIGCDAVIAIEMIEHMLPHDLDRFVHTVFGFIKPWIVIFTTPNGDFNVLFKALEKNGLRRLDHFFEWSREQFNDWCSNIVVRYPLYTVVCQGIGPGPPGTLHHGCCSQLALFINKDYHKQQDWNINSLAVVSEGPNPKAVGELVECWENTEICTQTTDLDEPNLQAIESYTEFLYTDDPLCMAVVVRPGVSETISDTFLPLPTSNVTSCEEDEYFNQSDKILQCNLDTEVGKNFLMFDEYQCLDVRVPRSITNNRVYEFEDVASRLNCSTLQVKKFSKTTQNMLAKNKIESLAHTREVVDEIRHLTKTLNINGGRPDDGANIWCNINWCDNAPYWNQFYQIVGEYNYPFEEKSDECRILDLITDEINRKIDENFEEAPCNGNSIEIPMIHLMSVVQHITDDVDMVRDLLEWNGYDIVDDVLVHSRFVIDSASVATHDEDSQDVDTNLSDWDNITEVRSATLSEASTIVPDYHDRSLRRALSHKVRNIRTMLTADEDITAELDKVVCRLTKLALRTSRERTAPPSLKWMQCKLLDLLTLTEKAIERRKKHLIENSWKAIEFGGVDSIKMTSLTQEDFVAKAIVHKYRHIVSPSGTASMRSAYDIAAIEDLSGTSIGFSKDSQYLETDSPNIVESPILSKTKMFDTESFGLKTNINSIEKTKAWLNVDVQEIPSFKRHEDYVINSEDTDSMSNVELKQNKLKHEEHINKEVETAICATPSSKSSSHKCKSKREDKKRQSSNTRITKKAARNGTKINGHFNIAKNCTNKFLAVNYSSCIVRSKKICKENRCLTMRATKPIPESLINLCHPELKVKKCINDFNVLTDVTNSNKVLVSNKRSSIEDNVLIDVMMKDTQDLDLHKNIAIDAEEAEIDDIFCEKDPVEILNNDIDLNLCTKHAVSSENICSQTIFLNDINEPSTSKGIRHNVSMDVQCGPDSIAAYPMLSASTSLVRLSPVLPGIKIHDGSTDAKPQFRDSATTAQDTDNDILITPRSRSVGIKIKDSDVNICAATESYVIPQKSRKESLIPRCVSIRPKSWSPIPRSWSPESNGMVLQSKIDTNTINSTTETDLREPASSTINTENVGSTICMSGSSIQKSSDQNLDTDQNTNTMIPTTPFKEDKDEINNDNLPSTKGSITKLCCGGIDVHSYKDKEGSVDIVYQGEWQRYRMKFGRKKTFNTILAKKLTDPINRKQKDMIQEKRVNSKDKLSAKNTGKKDTKLEPKKPSQTHTKSNESKKSNSKLPKFVKDVKHIRPVRPPSITVAKVSSKMTVCSITSKNVKSAFTAKKPQITTGNIVKKEDGKYIKKNYIPMYLLKRKKQNALIEKGNLSKNSVTSYELRKEVINSEIPLLESSKPGEISKDLISFGHNIPKTTYIVLHNKQQDNCSSTDKQQIPNVAGVANDENKKKEGNYMKRALSPQSLNSSTCSSLNSIATVRAVGTKTKNLANRRHSASSYKSSMNTSESDNATPTKTKRNIKRCKSARKSESIKDANNKENIPDTTENFSNIETDKFLSSPFVGKLKSVCIAQLKTDRASVQTTTCNLSKHKTFNTIPDSENSVDCKRSLSVSPTRKRSLKEDIALLKHEKISNSDMSHNNVDSANMVIELKPQEPTRRLSETQNVVSADNVSNTVENSLLAEWIQNLPYGSHTSNCTIYMRHLVEELLDSVNYDSIVHFKPSSINQNDVKNVSIELSESACSFKTVAIGDNLDNTFTEKDIEDSLNRTFESAIEFDSMFSLTGNNMTVTELDLLSFESSISPIKQSEHYLAENDLDTVTVSLENTQTPVVNNLVSETEDLGNKESGVVQSEPDAKNNPTSILINQKPVSSGIPDPIALIDSETGSFAMTERQTTSGEVIVSSRSSESYQSCLIDEDAVVPSWLFQIMTQHHSETENQPQAGPQLPMIAEPRLDVNGNAVEPGIVGVDAGAGDGRGIHSDQSQDSSGRGTSLSSSETSSSRVSQNEDIFIEPLSFTGQFELLQSAMASSDAGPTETPEFNQREESLDNETLPVTGHSRRRPRTQFNVVSDIDADISSIDTDVPDSSDNN